MSNQAGLTLVVDNSVQFGEALSNLEKILKRIDASLATSGRAFDVFNKQLKVLSGSRAYLAVDKLGVSLSKLDQSIEGIAPRLGGIFRDLEQQFSGSNLPQAFAEQGKRIGESFLTAIRRIWGISSPSSVFRGYAQDLVNGFNAGASAFRGIVDQAAGFARGFGERFKDVGVEVIRGAGHIFAQVAREMFNNVGEQIAVFGRDIEVRALASIQGGAQQVLAGGFAAFVQSQALQGAANFDQISRQIAVFGRLSTDQIAIVEQQILDFAANTVFLPTQVADAFLNLQKAGLDTAAALEGLPYVLDLATAAGIDLSEATTIAIQAANAFKIPFSQVNRVVNAFIGGADISTAEALDLAGALGFVGSSAASLGIPIEDVTAALALLNDQGIAGERAGTGLRAVLDSLAAPTTDARNTLAALGISLQDQEGNFIGLESVIQQFRTSITGLREAGFGDVQIIEQLSALGDRNAIAGLLSLINTTADGAGAFEVYRQSLESANTAQTVAAAQAASFNGTVARLRASFNVLLDRALLPLLRRGIQPIVENAIILVNRLSQLPEPLLLAASAGAALATAFVTLSGLFRIAGGVLLLPIARGFTLLGGAIQAVTAVIFNPLGLIQAIAGIGAVMLPLIPLFALIGGAAVVGFAVIRDVVNLVSNDVDGAGVAFGSLAETIRQTVSAVFGIISGVIDLIGGFARDILGLDQTVSGTGLVAFFSDVELRVRGVLDVLNEVKAIIDFIGAATGIIQPPEVSTRGIVDPALLEDRAELLQRIATETETAWTTEGARLVDKAASDLESMGAMLEQRQLLVRLFAQMQVGNGIDENTGQLIRPYPVELIIPQDELIRELEALDTLIAAQEAYNIPIRLTADEFTDQTAAIAAQSPLFRQLFGNTDDIDLAIAQIEDFKGRVAGLVASIQEFITGAVSEGRRLYDTVITPVLNELGDGLRGFLTAFSDPKLRGDLEQIVNSIVTLFRGIANVSVDVITGTLSGVSDALPQFGNALRSVLSAVADLTRGDIPGAVEGSVTAMVNLADAFLSFTGGIADGIINAINGVTGLSLPSVADGLRGLIDGIEAFGSVVRILVDRIARSVDDLVLRARLEVLRFVSTINDQIYELTGGSINVNPQVAIDFSEVEYQVQTQQIADGAEAVINAALAAGEPINMQAPFTLDVEGSTISYASFAALLEDPAIIEQLSLTGREAIANALGQAIGNNDVPAISALFPLVLNPEIVDPGLLAQTVRDQAQLAVESGDPLRINFAQTTASTLGINIDDILLGFDAPAIETGTQIGAAVAEGVTAGLTESGADSVAAVDELVTLIQSAFNDPLGIQSPSTFGMGVGQFIVEGIVLGLETFKPLIQGSSALIVQMILDIETKTRGVGARVAADFTSAVTAFGEQRSRLSEFINMARSDLDQLSIAADKVAAAIAAVLVQVGQLPSGVALIPAGGATFGGGRATGGAVSADRYYETNEGGVPEMFTSGGRTYLLPGRAGMVEPLASNTYNGGTSVNNVTQNYTINVTSIGDPAATADAVAARIRADGRANPVQRRLTRRGSI